MRRFTVELKRTAATKLQKLLGEPRKRIVTALKELEINPFPAGKKVKPFVGRAKTFRLRVGDYRVVFEVGDRLVMVLDIFHRRDLGKFKA